MARKRRYRYRRRGAIPRPPLDEPTRGAMLVQAFFETVVAILAGLINLVRRLCIRTSVRPPVIGQYPPPNPRVGNLSARPPVAPARSQTPPPIRNCASDRTAPPGQQNLPYRRAPYLLSKGERAFWHPLYLAVHGKYRIFCKVRLADIVIAPIFRRDERRWFRKIGSYHVDFVICEPRTTAPLLVIELDDRSHTSPQRRKRDEFKHAVLAAANVPLHRVPAQQAYDPAGLAQKIQQLIGPAD